MAKLALPAAASLLAAHPATAIGPSAPYVPPSSISRAAARPEPWSLNASDMNRIARGRALILSGDGGLSALVLHGARMRSEHGGLDHFALYEIGAEAGIDLRGGFAADAGGTFTLMSRRVALIEPDSRPRQTFLVRAGLALRRGTADRLALDFVDVAPASSRSDPARISELLGGSPIAARGFRLAYGHRFDTRVGRQWQLGLAASALDVPTQDTEILGGRGGMDRRVALNLEAGF